MMRKPTIRHDKSTTSIVSVCSDCPSWFAFAFDPDDADAAEIDHLTRCHDVPSKVARKSVDMRRSRRRRAGHS
jgi:hypothetical protein